MDITVAIAIVADIVTIIGLIISVVSLRRSIHQLSTKIDRLVVIETGGVFAHSKIDQVHIHNYPKR